ncbi:MAG: phage holin family protein [Bacteroidota bacterium]
MEIKDKLEKLFGGVKDYAETRFDLLVLTAREKVSNLVSSLVVIIVLGILGIFIFLFAGIGTALWLGDYFNNSALGFFCVTGLYVFITLLLLFNRDKWIKLPIINSLIKNTNFNAEG